MFINKKAQGLPITTIIAAVIGLIILVVIVMMITGKLGAFGEGLGRAASCENMCKTMGYDFGNGLSESGCDSLTKSRVIPGTYSDVSGKTEIDAEKVCCCYSA